MDTNTKRLFAELESEVLASLTDANAKRTVKATFKAFVNRQSGSIKMKKVSSSTVKEIGYDATTETLRVEFLTGAVYDYLRVPLNEYVDLDNAASVGRQLNARIKPNYGTVKIKD